MNAKKFLLGSLLAGGALALLRTAFIHTASAGSTSQNADFCAIDAYIEEQRRRLRIPGMSLAIVEGGQITHYCSFGRARPEGELPTAQTPFFIGSLTKSFTALAVMQQVEAGKIELDAPVQRYLPWFRAAPPRGRVADPRASAMTVRHLLNQTSGLPMLEGMTNLANFDDRPDAAERQARGLTALKLTRPPGAKFEYSNLNYNVLGLILEVASGETYGEYIQRHIFDPLGMSRSTISAAAARRNGLAVGHRHWFGMPIPAPDLPVPRGSLASGQLISTAEDMAHYLIAQLNGGRHGKAQILSSQGIEELHRPAAEIIEMGTSYGHYAMGWISEGSGEARIVSHSGIVPNSGGFMAILPGQNKGMVLLYNANHAMLKMTLDELGLNAARILAGLPPAPTQFGAVPWMMRGLLLIPILQMIGAAATLRRLRRWRQNPAQRPSRGRMWGEHILLPLIPNLALVSLLAFLLGRSMLGFVRLFAPDAYWVALLSGGFAGIWAFLRTALMLRKEK